MASAANLEEQVHTIVAGAKISEEVQDGELVRRIRRGDGPHLKCSRIGMHRKSTALRCG